MDCKVLCSKAKYLIGKNDDGRFISLIFTLWASLFELRPDRVKNCDFALKCLVERSEIPLPGHMKASDSCKIQVLARTFTFDNC